MGSQERERGSGVENGSPEVPEARLVRRSKAHIEKIWGKITVPEKGKPRSF